MNEEMERKLMKLLEMRWKKNKSNNNNFQLESKQTFADNKVFPSLILSFDFAKKKQNIHLRKFYQKKKQSEIISN